MIYTSKLLLYSSFVVIIVLMKLSYLFIFFTILFYSQTVFTVFAASTDCTITAVLRVGSKGAEVQCLQESLNLSENFRLSVDGSFGPLTKIAVVTFQSGNKLSPDGVVGPLTRAVLNGVVASGIYPVGCTGITGYSTTTGAKCDGSSNISTVNPLTDNTSLVPPLATNDNNKNLEPPGGIIVNNSTVNPNLVNLDKFINTVAEVQRKKGANEQEIKKITDAISKIATTSGIDYNKKFQELLTNESKLSTNFKIQPSLATIFDTILTRSLSFLGVIPSLAQAQAGMSFGGALLFPFLCDENWMLTIQPLPPTYVVLLSYYSGTQGFAGYNMPFTSWLLGTYIPVGICTIDEEVVISTEGTITPMTGSSPL